MIYDPAEDSFLLAKYVKQYARGKVLDMGSGSGILAAEAAKKTKNVTAVDLDKEAVVYLKNKGFHVVYSDLFEHVKGRYNLIIFNPPYLPEDPDEPEESRMATTGGKRGNEVIERFLKDAKKHLTIGGHILILVSSLTPDAEHLFMENGYEFELLEQKNLFFEKLKVYLLQ